MDAKELEFAEHYASTSCGVLHMHWAMDAFWGRVCKNYILPASLAIYDELVKRKQKKGYRFNDADDSVYYIPCKGRKVFVHTTQSRDYLYVIDYKGYSESDDSDPDFHIRRIWRPRRKDNFYTKEDLIKDVDTAIAKVDVLSEWADDHYEHSHRPSLSMYRKFKFEIPNDSATQGKHPWEVRFLYGDFRDAGYVLSYDGFLGSRRPPRVEGSRVSTSALEHISTIYLPVIAEKLGIKVPVLKGYRYGE